MSAIGLTCAGGAAALLFVACGSTRTVVKVRTVTSVRTVSKMTPIASRGRVSGQAGPVAARFWTERVYVPAEAWKSLDPRQRSRIERARFIRCEGARFVHTNEQQAQVDVLSARKQARHHWRVRVSVTIALNKGTPSATLLRTVIAVGVELLHGTWFWRLDNADVYQYAHLAKAGGSACPE